MALEIDIDIEKLKIYDEEEPSLQNAYCPVCSNPGIKSCSACQSVVYCSVEHQKLDWKLHKIDCKCYTIKENEELGRYVVATRDLKAGTLVLMEAPVSFAPKSIFSGKGNPNFCVGCNSLMMLPKDPFRKCSKCNWPCCSEICEKSPIHSENECPIFAKNKVEVLTAREQDLLVLRTCLLKHQNAAVWERIKNLQSDVATETKSLQAQAFDLEKIRKKIKLLGAIDNITTGDWQRISSTITVNAFAPEITPTVNEDGRTLRYSLLKHLRQFNILNIVAYIQMRIHNIFNDDEDRHDYFLTLEGSMFSHSCTPNCYWEASPPPEIKIVIRTAHDVKKGDMLTISYVIASAQGTQQRQTFLPFICKCVRCIDPFELGSNHSTWICKTCNSPELVSTDPLDAKADWKCGKCGVVDSQGEMKLFKIKQIYTILQNIPQNDKGAKKIHDLIAKYSGTNLHPNHWILTEAARKYISYIGNEQTKREITDEERNRYISHCKYILAVLDKVSAGINSPRAQLQHHLATAILGKCTNDKSCNRITLEEFLEELMRIYDLFKESYKYYKTECSESGIGIKGPLASKIEGDVEYIQQLLN